MDFFFLLCFITSMLVSIESGLVYCLITSKSPNFYNWMDRTFNILKNNREQNTSPETNDEEFVKVIDELNDVRETSTDTHSLNLEMDRTPEEISIRSQSYQEGLKINTELRHRRVKDVESTGSGEKRSLRDEYLEENNIQKIINYDDKMLYLTEEQQLIDTLLNTYINKFDNIVRIILPAIFFILIIVIMSYEI